MQKINDLRSLILQAKQAYFSAQPTMSDAQYDAMEDELRLLSPADPVLSIIGSPVPPDSMLTKAQHRIAMGSQSKINSEDELVAWVAKNGIDAVHASLKGDGASAAAYYKDGRLTQVISRGDGTTGEDITANAMRFKGLPAWVGNQQTGFSGAVRFEVILTVEDWTKVDPSRSKNPRNVGTGIMGRKNGHQSDYLTAFAFDIDEIVDGLSVAFSTESEKASRLKELGFTVIPGDLFQSAEHAIAYFRSIALTRDALPFWIDGVVIKADDLAKQRELGITAGKPKGQVAWKFDSTGAESVLQAVLVSGGHTGGLFPTAQFSPVEIGGTTVSSASLANYDEIERLGLAIGDSVWVVKANDIIPKIIRVTDRPASRTPILTPTCCPFCAGEVGRKQKSAGEDGVIIVCKNPECVKKSTGKIGRWINSLDILGIGDSLLEALIERFELEDASGLYTLHTRQAELAQLVINVERDLRLGDKRAATLLAAIDLKRQLTLSEFLGSLGLESLGKRRVEIMVKAAAAAGNELATLSDWRTGKLRDAVFAAQAGVPGIGLQIQDGIDAMSALIDKLLAVGVVITPPAVLSKVGAVGADGSANAEAAPLKTICISGSLPSGKKKAAYKDPLLAAGYELLDDVVKGLTYLVLADPASVSAKSQKAAKLGIEVISEEQLIALVTPSSTVKEGSK